MGLSLCAGRAGWVLTSEVVATSREDLGGVIVERMQQVGDAKWEWGKGVWGVTP